MIMDRDKMMVLAELRASAHAEGFAFMDTGHGKVRILGNTAVDYWPFSQTRTAVYVGTDKAFVNQGIGDVINLARAQPDGDNDVYVDREQEEREAEDLAKEEVSDIESALDDLRRRIEMYGRHSLQVTACLETYDGDESFKQAALKMLNFSENAVTSAAPRPARQPSLQERLQERPSTPSPSIPPPLTATKQDRTDKTVARPDTLEYAVTKLEAGLTHLRAILRPCVKERQAPRIAGMMTDLLFLSQVIIDQLEKA